ncbi:MAG: hypothetical protein PHD00_12820, partial [Bacteroidales bacterium]|nr:hypothetical protein [Bacteroidales bacterium]
SIISKTAYPNLVPYIYQPNSKLPIAEHTISDNNYRLCLGQKCSIPTSNPNDIIKTLETEKPLG